MDFDLSKPQQLLQQSARDFFKQECPAEKVRELMETDTAFDAKLWEGISDQGWTGLIVPEEFGGLGLGTVELAVVAEEMGRACLPSPFISTVWASALIARTGSEGQKAQYLEAISAGTMKATVALQEASADWNPEAVQLKAERTGGSFRLNGRKEFVTDAAVADVILVIARSGDDLVIVPVSRNAEGVTVTLTPSIDATRKLYSVDFADVTVPESDALETGYRVKEALDAATGVATVALCAEMIGGMQWTLDTTVEYAKTRMQFDKPIGIYQAVQHRCAEMVLFTESARSSVYYAAWALSENDPSAKLAVSMAKAYCSDSARETGNRGIQMHGGIGFTWEHNLHLYYKRAKSSEIMFGDATYHRELIAKEVVDEPEK